MLILNTYAVYTSISVLKNLAEIFSKQMVKNYYVFRATARYRRSTALNFYAFIAHS